MSRLLLIVGVLLAALAAALLWASEPAEVGSAYKAKILCSEVFVAGRRFDDVVDDDFNEISPAMPFIGQRLDGADRSVTASIFGLGATTAEYRDGGCRYRRGDQPPLGAPPRNSGETRSWSSNLQAPAQRIADAAVADPIAGHRALIAIVDGAIVAEAYADGFNAETRFQSWSMAKSVLSTLIGKAADLEILAIDDPAPVPEWKGDAAREAITWRSLLAMESGLAWEEDYASTSSDVNRMLFTSDDFGGEAAASSIAQGPGEIFYYSSGTSNLLARTLDQRLDGLGIELRHFAEDEIFAKIGATSFVLETDPSGVFVGSSYVYATARDWARLGQLYLKNGAAPGGSRVLPKEWVDFVRAPTRASNGQYGAHFWLNLDGEDGRKRDWKGLPDDMYYMSGHDGQYVFIFPSHDTVIVRTGISRNSEAFTAGVADIEALFASASP